MAKKRTQRNRKPAAPPVAPPADQSATPPPVAVFIAITNPAGEGLVERGAALTDEEAVQWLLGRGSIVACDGEMRANRHRARELMTRAYNGALHDNPHDEGGRDFALPHFHPPGHTPRGVHAFYETAGRYARRSQS